MKTKILVAVLVVLFLAIVVANKDGRVVNILLSIINPVKQTYSSVTKDIEDKSQSFVYQKKNIQKLLRENKLLRKHLLQQKHYINQVKGLYKKIPSLEKMPKNSIDIIQTISYVKLNTFNQIILTKPRNLKGDKDKLYGLIQDEVAAGVAHVENNNLYGALVSSDKCRFSVFVGKERAAGIAIGINSKQMQVKFIPKWVKVKRGDRVYTSGLDMIFFEGVPVGVVEKVEIESSYKVAYIKPYADILHPDYFYLVIDPKVSLTSRFDGEYICDCNQSRSLADRNITAPDENLSSMDMNQSDRELLEPHISSIPSILPEEPKKIIQTQEEVVSTEQMEPPAETQSRPVKKKKKVKPKKRPKIENLDMF